MMVLDLNFCENFCCGGGEEKNTLVKGGCVRVPNGLESFANTRQGLILTWLPASTYCFNISGHMVLIALYIFSTGLFTFILQPDWLNLSDLQCDLVKYDNLHRQCRLKGKGKLQKPEQCICNSMTKLKSVTFPFSTALSYILL